MLVLTRKPGQSIMIGDGVEVQVLSVAGEKVRLGITAPRDVSIFRNEVYDRIENESASSGGGEEAESETNAADRETNAVVADALEKLTQP
jgi:carbon storage regulator